MSRAAFTPGPWEFAYERYEKRIPIRQGGFNLPAPPLGWVDSDDIDPKEAKANARLIAASPRMYEALEAFPDPAHSANPFEYLDAVAEWQIAHVSPTLEQARGKHVAAPAARKTLEGHQAELVEAVERIRDEANTVCGDWRDTASMIDSICLAALAKIGGDA